MSLKRLCWPRVVVLNPSASALEAARGMESSAIGTVVVQESGRVVGLLTDRDLAIRVVGQARDAKATRVPRSCRLTSRRSRPRRAGWMLSG
jgi:CBS domain-containing protein